MPYHEKWVNIITQRGRLTAVAGRWNTKRLTAVIIATGIVSFGAITAVAAPALLAGRNGGFVTPRVAPAADIARVENELLPRLASVSQPAGSYPELAGRLRGLIEGRVERRPVEVRGIYWTAFTAGASRADELIKLIDETELNAVVIDIKEDTGRVSYMTDYGAAIATGAPSAKIRDIDTLMGKLRDHDIYPIARVVTFKDEVLAAARPDLAIRYADGRVWRDRTGQGWLNPYKRETWDYIIGIAADAARHGFREIQFDYVRFPSDGKVKEMQIETGGDTRTHREVIRDFLKYAREQLAPQGVFVSADVFGLVTAVSGDMTIGQNYEDIIANVDYVSPMVYPSHYGPGNYGIPNPDAAPYLTVNKAMVDAVKRQGDSKCIVRPWLQDFTLRTHYGPEEVRAQIQATYDAGLREWILWNPWNRYTTAALKPAGE